MQLIVANQTLGGAALEREVRHRVDRGQQRFFIVVPMIEPRLETAAWAVADEGFVPPPSEEEVESALAEARTRSAHRLAQMVAMIQSIGGTADGEVGPTDPLEAVREVLERRTFDEIIVSTLPAGISRWLKLDLPSRIARITDIPVVTVEAEPQPR